MDEKQVEELSQHQVDFSEVREGLEKSQDLDEQMEILVRKLELTEKDLKEREQVAQHIQVIKTMISSRHKITFFL